MRYKDFLKLNMVTPLILAFSNGKSFRMTLVVDMSKKLCLGQLFLCLLLTGSSLLRVVKPV